MKTEFEQFSCFVQHSGLTHTRIILAVFPVFSQVIFTAERANIGLLQSFWRELLFCCCLLCSHTESVWLLLLREIGVLHFMCFAFSNWGHIMVYGTHSEHHWGEGNSKNAHCSTALMTANGWCLYCLERVWINMRYNWLWWAFMTC